MTIPVPEIAFVDIFIFIPELTIPVRTIAGKTLGLHHRSGAAKKKEKENTEGHRNSFAQM